MLVREFSLQYVNTQQHKPVQAFLYTCTCVISALSPLQMDPAYDAGVFCVSVLPTSLMMAVTQVHPSVVHKFISYSSAASEASDTLENVLSIEEVKYESTIIF